MDPGGEGVRKGWAGREGRPWLRGTEVGRAEPFGVVRVQLVEVCVQERAGGRIRASDGIFSDGTGPPGFEPGFEAPEASVMSKLYYGPIGRFGGAVAPPRPAAARCEVGV